MLLYSFIAGSRDFTAMITLVHTIKSPKYQRKKQLKKSHSRELYKSVQDYRGRKIRSCICKILIFKFHFYIFYFIFIYSVVLYQSYYSELNLLLMAMMMTMTLLLQLFFYLYIFAFYNVLSCSNSLQKKKNNN